MPGQHWDNCGSAPVRSLRQAERGDRLVSLGARRVDWDRYPDDPDFIVLADTEGNRFCIVDLAMSTPNDDPAPRKPVDAIQAAALSWARSTPGQSRRPASPASVTVTMRLASLVVIQRCSSMLLVRAAPRLPAR